MPKPRPKGQKSQRRIRRKKLLHASRRRISRPRKAGSTLTLSKMRKFYNQLKQKNLVRKTSLLPNGRVPFYKKYTSWICNDAAFERFLFRRRTDPVSSSSASQFQELARALVGRGVPVDDVPKYILKKFDQIAEKDGDLTYAGTNFRLDAKDLLEDKKITRAQYENTQDVIHFFRTVSGTLAGAHENVKHYVKERSGAQLLAGE